MIRIIYKSAIAVLGCGIAGGCKPEPVPFSTNDCKRPSSFISRIGFDPSRSYFSTSDSRVMGLQLIQAADLQHPDASVSKVYQDSSWKRAGWLAAMQTDANGNLFVAPAPFINLLNNDPRQRNTLYRVDGTSGDLRPFVQLPVPDGVPDQQAFGIIGLAYLCEADQLYVSTVAGSDRQHIRGKVYRIQASTGKIEESLNGIDAMGLGITYVTGERLLLIGNGRNSSVMAVKLNAQGAFEGKPYEIFSLEGQGPRGDDKVRRIRTQQDGSLLVYGMEFNFNLIAPHEKQEGKYWFVFDETDRKWLFKSGLPSGGK